MGFALTFAAIKVTSIIPIHSQVRVKFLLENFIISAAEIKVLVDCYKNKTR